MNTEPGDTWDLTWRYLGLDHRTWHYFMFFHVFVHILACLNHSKPEQHKHRHRHPRSQPSSEDIGGVKQCKMQAKQCHNDCRVCFMMFNGLKSRAIFPPNKGTNQQLKDTQRLHCGSLWMVMGIECILCFDTSGSKSDSWNGASEHDFVFFCPPCPPRVEMWHVFNSWFDAQLEIWQAFSSFPPKQQERIQWNTDRASLTCDVQLQRPTGSQRSCWSFCCL